MIISKFKNSNLSIFIILFLIAILVNYQLFLDYNFIKIEQYKDLNGIIRVTSGKI